MPNGPRIATLTFADHELAVLSWDTSGATEEGAPTAALTMSERAVMELLLAGVKNQDIARARGRSPATVARQIEAIYRKLGVTSRAELAARCAVVPIARSQRALRVTRTRPDVIAVVERAYALAGDDLTWLSHLHEAAHPLLDQGLGTAALLFHVSAEGRLVIDGADVRLLPVEVTAALVGATRPECVRALIGRGDACATWSELTGLGSRLAHDVDWIRCVRPWGIRDFFGVTAFAGPRGAGCNLGAAAGAPVRTTVTRRRTWSRVAVHIATGLKLRRALANAPDQPVSAESNVTSDGRFLHAAGAAVSTDAREVLRAAVDRMERARGSVWRSDSEAALAWWQELVVGAWSLVDRYERSGRGYLVAHRNDPAMPDPRALSPRESEVVELAARGLANKLIAYQLGASLSSVATHLGRAMTKLGVATRAELIALARVVRPSARP